jgi:hypothetical protein
MAQEANHSLADRRQAKEQVQQVASDGVQTILSIWEPMIQFHGVVFKIYADAFEAMASSLNQHRNKLTA